MVHFTHPTPNRQTACRETSHDREYSTFTNSFERDSPMEYSDMSRDVHGVVDPSREVAFEAPGEAVYPRVVRVVSEEWMHPESNPRPV